MVKPSIESICRAVSVRLRQLSLTLSHLHTHKCSGAAKLLESYQGRLICNRSHSNSTCYSNYCWKLSWTTCFTVKLPFKGTHSHSHVCVFVLLVHYLEIISKRPEGHLDLTVTTEMGGKHNMLHQNVSVLVLVCNYSFTWSQKCINTRYVNCTIGITATERQNCWQSVSFQIATQGWSAGSSWEAKTVHKLFLTTDLPFLASLYMCFIGHLESTL